jgi:hypothetical protein
VASAATAMMARRMEASALSTAVLRWMMHMFTHWRSSGWPGGSGSRSSKVGHAGSGGLLAGVDPLAWEPTGVPVLPGTRCARMKHSCPAALLLPSAGGDLGLLQSRARWL